MSKSNGRSNGSSNGHSDRREFHRYSTSISVDYRKDEDDFLFSYIENISEMGIFIGSDEPLPVGTELSVRFSNSDGEALEFDGVVVWVNLPRSDESGGNPGMGVHFRGLEKEQRKQLVDLVKTIAYLHDDRTNLS